MLLAAGFRYAYGWRWHALLVGSRHVGFPLFLSVTQLARPRFAGGLASFVAASGSLAFIPLCSLKEPLGAFAMLRRARPVFLGVEGKRARVVGCPAGSKTAGMSFPTLGFVWC